MNEAIRKAMKDKGLTQKMVAKAMGIRHESLNRILREPLTSSQADRIEHAMELAVQDRITFYKGC